MNSEYCTCKNYSCKLHPLDTPMAKAKGILWW